MHNDAMDWLEGIPTPEGVEAKYGYYLMRDPSMRQFTGPKEEEWDPLTGTTATFRHSRMALLRGQRPENMRPVKVYLAFDGQRCVPHYRIDNPKPPQGWYQSGDEVRKGSRVRPCEADAVLLQPYGGSCAINCYFCYVDNGIYGGRGSGLMNVPVNFGEYMSKQIDKMLQAAPFYLSPFTEPLLPGLESFYHNTENAMRAIDRAGLPMFVLTRAACPDFVFELVRKNPHSYMQFSLNTPHEEDWVKLSPGAASLTQHMDDIRRCRSEGIYVSIQINPVMAGITTHEDVELLMETLAEAGADHTIVKFVETSMPSAGAMVERTAKRFGDNRAAAFRDLFTENCCGAQRTITEEYRREGHTRYSRQASRLGMTYATCYEYGRDPSHPTGWRSLGPEYKTTPNCHGPSSVVYTRSRAFTDSGKPVAFHEVASCSPSGCLSCSSDNGGQPRCGDLKMGRAIAKVFSDFRQAVAPSVV